MRKLGTILIAGAFVLGLVGCGGDDDSSSDDTTTTTEEEDEATTTTEDDEEATTTTTEEEDGGGEGASGEASAAYCNAAEEIVGFNDLDVDFTDPNAEDILSDFLDVLGVMRDEAPGDVADAIDEIGETIEDLFQASIAAGDDVEAQSDAALQVLEDHPTFEDASQVVDEFTEAGCDVDFEGDGNDSEGGGLDPEAGDPTDPPDIDDPDLAELADQCHDGSGQACDDLYFQTPVGSPEEDYGQTCGGRFETSRPGSCAEAIGG